MRRFLIISLLLCWILLGVAAGLGYQLLFAPLQPPARVTLTIAPGSSLIQVAHQLTENGVIRHSYSLRLLSHWLRPGEQIKAGTYTFTDSAKPARVLDRLISGDMDKVSLTIPEGFTLEQIVCRIAAAGYGNADKLYELAHDTSFIQSLQLNSSSLEGYLFPETYLFAPGIKEAALLKMMVLQFRKHLDNLLLADAQKLGLNLHQLVTLASIIEKETAQPAEMPLIASVFHNRLKRGIPLQTDPTVIYGIKNFDGNLTRKHLQTPGPYNTYLNHGLPPGPIASPGLSALQAAAHPADSAYLYFVARGDGNHQFSKTLQEHNAAVRKYQLHR